MLGLASDVFESYSAGTEIKSSINQDAANVYQEMAELLGITLKQVMDFAMTMMVYTQGIGTLIASGIVKDTKENMYRMQTVAYLIISVTRSTTEKSCSYRQQKVSQTVSGLTFARNRR